MKAKGNYYAWLIAYIDNKHIDKVQTQLDKYIEFSEVEPVIPTVKVLKKQFKGKHEFQEVPLLFNYGFFKVPRKVAIHKEFLETLQQRISCIYGWVKDPLKIITSTRGIKKVKRPKRKKTKKKGARGKKIITDYNIPVATATPEQISMLVRKSMELGIHSSEELELLKPGDYIILKGYPFEGVEAEFVSMNPKKRKLLVKMCIMDNIQQVEVSFDNVFFSIYQNEGYDDSITVKKSLDQMNDSKTLDKLMHKVHKTNTNASD